MIADTCPTRRIEADGRVLACEVDWHGHGDGCAPGHMVEFDDGGAVEWMDGDPLSWDATCPDCDQGHVVGYDLDGNPTDEPCPRCEGAGTVDTIPTRLIGKGSELELDRGQLTPEEGIIAEVYDGDPLILRGRVHWWVDGASWDDIGPDGPWRLVRAVPPAADDL